MGFVAVTVGFAALGGYLGRDLSGATRLVLFIGAFACLRLNIAAAKGRGQLAIGLLFGLGLLLGLAAAPVIADYANADPSALCQAAGATAAFVAGCGAYGYATRRDLSSWAHPVWAVLGLIVFGIVATFVSIPNFNLIYAIAGLGILRRVHDLRLQPAASRQPRWPSASVRSPRPPACTLCRSRSTGHRRRPRRPGSAADRRPRRPGPNRPPARHRQHRAARQYHPPAAPAAHQLWAAARLAASGHSDSPSKRRCSCRGTPPGGCTEGGTP